MGLNNPHDLDALVRMLEYPWKPEGPYRAAALAYDTFATVVPWEATRPERSVPLLYTGTGPTPRLARMRAMRACFLEHPPRTANGRPPAFSDAETLYYNAVLDSWVRDLFGDNAAITRGVLWQHWKHPYAGAPRYRVCGTSTGRERGGKGLEGQLLVTFTATVHGDALPATAGPLGPFEAHTRTAREFVESFQVAGYRWPAEPTHLFGAVPAEGPEVLESPP